MTRTVFKTLIESNTSHAKVFSAIEVGVHFENNTVSRKEILYRTLEGSVYDITKDVSIIDSRSGLIHLTKQASNIEPMIGFDIVFTNIQNENASFDGTLIRENIHISWKGSYVAFRNTPIAVIQAGLQPIDEDVENFLELSPLINVDDHPEAVDMAEQWSASIYQEMLLHSTSSRARNWFYKKLGILGDDFASNKLQHTLPRALTVESPGTAYLHLVKILADNTRLLELAAWHHLCHSLKSAAWLSREFQDSINDKIVDFYAMLRCPSNELDAAKQRYGSGFPAATEVSALRLQYTNTINRCYHAAYYCYKQEAWDMFLKEPVRFSNKCQDVIQGDPYIEHHLPRWVRLQDMKGSLSFQRRLGLLRDKMMFLAIIGQERDSTHAMLDTDASISKLAKAVGEMGIVPNATMITPDSQA